MATRRVVITVTSYKEKKLHKLNMVMAHTFAGVGLFSNGRPPRKVVEEVFALLAVSAFGVVGALTSSVHHVRLRFDAGQRKASVGVSVTRAGTSHNHVGDRVVVLLLYLGSFVQQVVTQGMQLGEVDTQVGHFQQALHLFGVGVED